ncbi:hypothetical protein VTI74DRAFT_3933 [Chaetomium olivicolor]
MPLRRLLLHSFDGDDSDQARKHPWERKTLAIWIQKTALGSGYVRFKATELCSLVPSNLWFEDPATIRIATSLTEQEIQEARIASPAIDLSWFTCDTLCISCFPPPNLEFECSYHPAHLWACEMYGHTGIMTCKDEQFTIGLVDVIVSSTFNHQSYTQTFWVICGLLRRRQGGPMMAWAEVTHEMLDGTIPMALELYHRNDLVNPYMPSTVLGRIHEAAVKTGVNFRTTCSARLAPSYYVRLSMLVSSRRKFKSEPAIHMFTIQLENVNVDSADKN